MTVSYDDYLRLYRSYEQTRDTATALGLLFLAATALGLTVALLYTRERRRRHELQEELDQLTGPDHQLALIRSAGAAGREEMRRTVAEVHQALVTITGEGR